MNSMYAVVLVLVVLASTSSTLCFASNNAGDQEIFMVVDDETTFHDAAMGMSKANSVQIGKFLLEDGKLLTLSRKSLSPRKSCIEIDQPCGLLDHWCSPGLTCNGLIKGTCLSDIPCLPKGYDCGISTIPCCPTLKCAGGAAGYFCT